MDYCSSCRRHLNGALVCPGCGAYAPDIAPPADLLPGAYTESPAPEHGRAVHHRADGASDPYTSDQDPPAPDASGLDASGQDTSSGIAGQVATGRGRAARRRQLARWKKHRRRAAAATAVALFGGGLSMAALSAVRPSAGHTQAASPPEPVNASATPQAAASDSSSEHPESRESSDRATRAAVKAGARQTAAASPTAPENSGQERASAADRAVAPTAPGTRKHSAAASAPVAAADAAPEPAPGTGGDSGGGTSSETTPDQAQVQSPAPAPEPTEPATTERPGLVGTVVGLLPGTSAEEPTSPAHVCLIGVCLG
ncbi:SCO2400 family protein [Streptomyces sp. NPDC054887]